MECLGTDRSADGRCPWICAWRVLRPMLAVVIALLKATAVWDWWAMVCPAPDSLSTPEAGRADFAPSMEPCQEGSPALRARHLAGLLNCWMNDWDPQVLPQKGAWQGEKNASPQAPGKIRAPPWALPPSLLSSLLPSLSLMASRT